MKIVSIIVVTSTLAVAGIAPAFAANDGTDSPTYQEQMTNLWIATGNPTYARLAGLSDQQISEAARVPVETNTLD
jgi:hypothetical protein